jgi:very-short-patch-repair endonuclease
MSELYSNQNITDYEYEIIKYYEDELEFTKKYYENELELIKKYYEDKIKQLMSKPLKIKNKFNKVEYIDNSIKININCKNRIKKINPQYYPQDINKTESKLLNILQDYYYYSDIIVQFKMNNCKIKKDLFFDFLIEEHKIIIELDGPQHFKQVSNCKSPEKIQKRDKYKMQCANENGYSVIRLYQEDVWKDKFNWIEKLDDIIEYIVHNEIVINVFISKDENLYNDYL